MHRHRKASEVRLLAEDHCLRGRHDEICASEQEVCGKHCYINLRSAVAHASNGKFDPRPFVEDVNRDRTLINEMPRSDYVLSFTYIKNERGSITGEASEAGFVIERPDPQSAAKQSTSSDQEVVSSPTSAVKVAALVAKHRRVFITHGKNQAFIEPIKKLLGFGQMEPVVSVEKQSVSKPVPDKVMEDMRSCSAAIIHVDGELKLMDAEANEHTSINPNVLIEIGAAMALYDRRFVLLVKQGVKLPSNLQGLYEVRYTGDSLDGDTTIRIMEAINEIKKTPLPAW